MIEARLKIQKYSVIKATMEHGATAAMLPTILSRKHFFHAYVYKIVKVKR